MSLESASKKIIKKSLIAAVSLTAALRSDNPEAKGGKMRQVIEGVHEVAIHTLQFPIAGEKPSSDELEDSRAIGDDIPDGLPRPDQEKIINIKRSLESKYGVKLKFLQKNGQDGRYELGPITEPELLLLEVEKIKAHLDKIPPLFFKKLDISKIIFTGEITEDTPAGKERYWAIAAAKTGRSGIYANKAWPLHHELFHIMDGKLGKGLGVKGAINPEEWKLYSKGMEQNGQWMRLEDEVPHAIDEEQAEYCRALFNMDDQKVYESKYAPILNNEGKLKKLKLMKQWLFEWSDGLLDEKYWQDLRDGKVDENYWPSK